MASRCRWSGKNRHQHYAYIGDAVPDSLHYKDMLQFKQMGLNVVRTAHYPQDNALLDACDELGILVYEEAPTWISIGNDAWFDNLEKAARRMVRNHRNHPSVIIWGGGINHRGYVPRLHYAVKEEDPTRWTGSNNAEWTGVQNSGVCDLFTNMDYGGIKDWSGKEYLLAMEGGSGHPTLSRSTRAIRYGSASLPGLATPTTRSTSARTNGTGCEADRSTASARKSPPRDATSGEPVAMQLDARHGRPHADGRRRRYRYRTTRDFFDSDGNDRAEIRPARCITRSPARQTIVGDGQLEGVNPIGLSRGAAPALIRATTRAGQDHRPCRMRGTRTSGGDRHRAIRSTPTIVAANAKPIYDLGEGPRRPGRRRATRAVRLDALVRRKQRRRVGQPAQHGRVRRRAASAAPTTASPAGSAR